jgi:hypothetical protein
VDDIGRSADFLSELCPNVLWVVVFIYPRTLIAIFLDDEEVGADVAAFSSDSLKADAALRSQMRCLVLQYADSFSQHPGADNSKFPSNFESQSLRAVRSSLLIPISSNGRLHGLASLGQRLSELPYVLEDKCLLLVFANQVLTQSYRLLRVLQSE